MVPWVKQELRCRRVCLSSFRALTPYRGSGKEVHCQLPLARPAPTGIEWLPSSGSKAAGGRAEHVRDRKRMEPAELHQKRPSPCGLPHRAGRPRESALAALVGRFVRQGIGSAHDDFSRRRRLVRKRLTKKQQWIRRPGQGLGACKLVVRHHRLLAPRARPQVAAGAGGGAGKEHAVVTGAGLDAPRSPRPGTPGSVRPVSRQGLRVRHDRRPRVCARVAERANLRQADHRLAHLREKTNAE